jgi:peptidoglycan/LPS O-acetylase OafA/YrhL
VNRETSLYLDIIRPLAAVIVLLSHMSYPNLSGQLAFMSAVGVQAVSVFFVLSGFVIAHVSNTGERDARSYFLSRAARIYSVAIPAIILTLVLDYVGSHFDPNTYMLGPVQQVGPGLLLRSITFTGEQWTAHRFPGTNGPYWSLGFEVWYYLAFGVFIFASKKWGLLATALVLLFVGPKVALLFPLWLMGVGLYKLCAPPLAVNRTVGWLLYSVSLVTVSLYQLFPQPRALPFTNVTESDYIWCLAQNYLIGALFCAHILGFVVVSKSFTAVLERSSSAVRWISGATFSIYLMHLPVAFFWPRFCRYQREIR